MNNSISTSSDHAGPEHETARLRETVSALQPLAEQYQLLVENVRDFALIRIDVDNRIIGWGKGAQRLLGYGDEEILGQSGTVIFTPEDRAAGEPEKELSSARREGRAEDERWHMRKDGSRFWGSGVMTAMRDEAGQLRGFYKILRDLTVRRQAEEAVRQSEERLRRFIENVTDYALIQVDPDGNVSSWNPGAERILGYSGHEVLHRPAAILFTEEDRAANLLRQDMATALAEGRAEYERWMVRKDRTRFFARWVTTPIRDEQGHLLGYAKVLRDETKRRKADERLRASLIERDTLLKEIHHRVKNNLQVIVSLLSLQSDQISDAAALEMFQDTQSRVRAIARIHETLYSSADLAQIEFAQYTRVLVQDVFSFYGVSPKHIHLHVETEDMVLTITQAIPLGLILNELVVNCLKHAFPAGRTGLIKVSLRYVDESIGPGQTLDDAMGQLCVEDNGVGLPSDFRFEQAESMGMYLVRILTRQLRGTVQLHQSGGARFSVMFPLTLDEPGAPQ